MAALGFSFAHGLTTAEIAARSRRELDRTLTHDAELTIARSSDDAVLAGAFQRRSDISANYTLFQRGSGGGAARVGPGTLWISLALARAGALTPCAPDRLVNRYVRPLLRALTKLGAAAHYFGRDWIAVAHRPCAAVGFAHDAASGRAQMEAVVALSTPFAVGPRASFAGKEPTTIRDVTGRDLDADAVARAIADAYAEAYARDLASAALPAAPLDGRELANEPPWQATLEEAIGIVGAGKDARGRTRVGGELLASRDAIAALEDRVAALAHDGDGDSTERVARAVNETLGAPGVAVEGVRSLASIADVIARALRA